DLHHGRHRAGLRSPALCRPQGRGDQLRRCAGALAGAQGHPRQHRLAWPDPDQRWRMAEDPRGSSRVLREDRGADSAGPHGFRRGSGQCGAVPGVSAECFHHRHQPGDCRWHDQAGSALMEGRLNCLLVAGGKWHDIDFARLELRKLLAEDQRVRVRVLEDYSNLEALEQADFLVSYTCDVTPSLAEQEALRRYVQGGRRWLALHGTNSILRFMEDDTIDTPNWAPVFMDTLGSIFQAHPPIAPYRVEPTGVEHPLVEDIEAFEVEDEQ